ncbi:helix-turn-helix domain-containing protein [Pedobacter sp. L105]|uniref:winged helix-turn-helix transcriptional regulator n=1 Tax=Pedobacter sp. L105 TaxID=1641871 RepID=UPI00131C228D|nr:helix-turn-helix domain-containing protein [Pedobacter sp. L105]
MKKGEEFSEHCKTQMLSIQDTLDVMGGKWKIKILTILYFGETHFMELQRRVNGIGSKMLSQELRDLETNGLVKRTVLDTRPITVEYELTPYGTTLKDIIEDMAIWGAKHRTKIIQEEKQKDHPQKVYA